MLSSQVDENETDGMIVFFLHFLMMATTLLGLSSAHEHCHGFENLVHSTQVFVQKMTVMDLKEPVITFVFL